MDDTIEKYIEKQLKLLEGERQEEEQRASSRKALIGDVSGVEGGMAGRTLVTIRNLSSKGAQLTKKDSSPAIDTVVSVGGAEFSTGDPVTLHKAGERSSEDAIRGVISSVGNKYMVVSMDDFDDEWCDSKVLLNVKPDDVTFKRLRTALTTSMYDYQKNLTIPCLKAYAQSPGRRIVEMVFGGRAPDYTRQLANKRTGKTETVSETETEAPLNESSATKAELLGTNPHMNLQFRNPDLNESQQHAVSLALHAKDAFLILGPPGSGKTTTVVELLWQLAKRGNKILVCTPSNIAADTICDKISGLSGVHSVRVGHTARVVQTVIPMSLDVQVQTSNGGEVVRGVKNDITKAYKEMQSLKRGQRGKRRELRGEVKMLNKELRQRETEAVKNVLAHADIVVCTLTSSVGRYMRDVQFDVLVIDEAAQALQASCWMAIPRCSKVIMAGDPFQLPPTVLSKQPGLEVTLFEKMYNDYKDEICEILNVQYRMHKDICTWSSAEFYENKLVCDESVESRLLCELPDVKEMDETSTPIMMIDTSADHFEESNDEGGSKMNYREAQTVFQYVEKLLKAGVKPIDIGVITPYSAQVDLLRTYMNDLEQPDLEVSTVDGFQGREKEAIVISFVRSNDNRDVGFLADARRMNVAVTRAKRHVCFIGNTQTASTDEFLSRLCSYFETNGLVLTPDDYT